MVEGATSKRGLANRTSSRCCCGRGYRSQSRHRSLKGHPSTVTYDNLCSLSDSQPYPHRHAYAYGDTTPDTHSCPARTHGHLYAHADPDPHAHPYARLQRTIPKLGVAILR